MLRNQLVTDRLPEHPRMAVIKLSRKVLHFNDDYVNNILTDCRLLFITPRSIVLLSDNNLSNHHSWKLNHVLSSIFWLQNDYKLTSYFSLLSNKFHLFQVANIFFYSSFLLIHPSITKNSERMHLPLQWKTTMGRPKEAAACTFINCRRLIAVQLNSR